MSSLIYKWLNYLRIYDTLRDTLSIVFPSIHNFAQKAHNFLIFHQED